MNENSFLISKEQESVRQKPSNKPNWFMTLKLVAVFGLSSFLFISSSDGFKNIRTYLEARDLADTQVDYCARDYAGFVGILLDQAGFLKTPTPAGYAFLADRGQLGGDDCYDLKVAGYDYRANFDYVIQNLDNTVSNCFTGSVCTGSNPEGSVSVTPVVPAGMALSEVIGCVESCFEDRLRGFSPLVNASGEPIDIMTCADPITVGFVYTPSLLKSCISPTELCKVDGIDSCEEGCYSCIDQCIAGYATNCSSKR